MKKIFFYLATWLSATISNANPVYIPRVYLEKFSFDENQKWEVVLKVYDSLNCVLISSSTGSSFCKSKTDIFDDYLVITTDSLISNVSINPEGDSVSIISYYFNWKNSLDSIVEMIVFGNYRNSTIPKPSKGQSIIRILTLLAGTDYHCICDSSGNDSGILHGKIFDKENQIITTGSFSLSPFPVFVSCADESYSAAGFDISKDGIYSTSLYALKYKLNTIDFCDKNYIGTSCYFYSVKETLRIDSLNLTVNPGSSSEIDIHLLDDLTDNNENEMKTSGFFKVFPNPVYAGNFRYEISTPVKSTSCYVELLDMNGQIIWHHNIIENAGDIILPSNIANGLYILKIWMNKKVYHSMQLIVNGK